MVLFFDLLRSVIYGVIEGITEWLPISSTGHMILAEQVLKFSFSAEFMEMFRVVIQLGAILAVVVMYFKKLWPFCVDNGRDSGLAKHVRWPVMRLWFKIIVACLPAAVLGLALDDWIDAHFYNSVVVAVMLIVYGIAFILIERRPRVPTTTKLSRITYRQALIVGAWQVLALIPGTSRSGSTIIGGLLCGMSRACASQFTFFLAIPVMAGASGLKLVKFLAGGGVFTVGEIGALLVGCIVAFVVSILAIRFLMDYVKKHTFTAFGWYRIALGIVVLGVWALQTFVLAKNSKKNAAARRRAAVFFCLGGAFVGAGQARPAAFPQTRFCLSVAGRACPPPTALRSYEFFGNVTRMVVPVPTWLCRSIFASCSRAMCLTMASPKPVPPVALERLLSTR